MGDRVKSLAEVQYRHVHLVSGVMGLKEIVHGGEELRLARVAGPEAVGLVCEDVEHL